MRAIINIELELDGEYLKTDDQTIIDAILTSLDATWEIDDDRLVLLKSATCRLKGRP